MPVVGIIAEYNPFHLGHQYQIQALRGLLGEDCGVVAVMSGNFVQRGDFALFPKYARAAAAVGCGADLVVELPTAYAMAGAETFAQGGVSLLAMAGVVTHLGFGSECGRLSQLEQLADCLDSEAYQAGLRRFLNEGMTFAAAREAAVRGILGGMADCLGQPNNNLGVEYLRAIRRTGAGLEPVTVRRVGAAHDSEGDETSASASAIRRRVLAGEPWKHLVPPAAAAVLEEAAARGLGPASAQRCGRGILAVLRRMEKEEFCRYDGGGEGLYSRFYDAVRRAADLEELFSLVKTKRYPLARIRRMAMAAYLRLAPPPERPPYLRVLAANERGRALLREMKRLGTPVLTKPADAGQLGPEAERLLEEERRYTDLYLLACPGRKGPGAEYRTGPVML